MKALRFIRSKVAFCIAAVVRSFDNHKKIINAIECVNGTLNNIKNDGKLYYMDETGAYLRGMEEAYKHVNWLLK